jgi:exosortase family protein XrtF
MNLNWNEFKPTIYFLIKFVGLYIALNLLYGYYIEQQNPKPDVPTILVTEQSATLLRLFGWDVAAHNHETKPTTYIAYEGRGIVSVYEGCNGLNVAIIFLCFLLAFGPLNKKLAWFIPVGLIVIHLTNLARIIGLFWVVIYLPNAVYFTHKYLFTAIIYAVVFIMWLVWLRINFRKNV